MHSTHHYDVGVGLGGLPGQRKGVAYEVGNLLYLVALIIVSHYKRVLLLLEPLDLLLQPGGFLLGRFHFSLYI